MTRKIYRRPSDRKQAAVPAGSWQHDDYATMVEKGKARVAAGEVAIFTREEAQAILLARYFASWELERAAHDFEQTCRDISSGCSGGCGPGGIWFETRAGKITAWPSELGPFGGGEPYVWSIASLLRLAMPVAPSGQARLF